MIHPYKNKFLVLPDDKKKKTDIGLELADEKDKRANSGIVQAGWIKEEKDSIYPTINDRLYFYEYGSREIEFEGIKYLIIDEEDILAFEKKDK